MSAQKSEVGTGVGNGGYAEQAIGEWAVRSSFTAASPMRSLHDSGTLS